MTPEARVKKAIDHVLVQGHAYYHKAVGTSYGKPCLDYDITKLGLYAAVEAKGSKSSHPTARQTMTMRAILSAGGSIFLIDYLYGADMRELELWLENPTPGFVSTSAKLWLEKHESSNARYRNTKPPT